jgi:acetylornithine deacetylase/succinyl-diaminopimelate desuccinylase-like protein
MRIAKVLLLLIAVTAIVTDNAFAQAAPDWKQLNAETLEYFTALVKLDTSNPPGHETKAAKYVQSILEKNGIPATVVGSDPDRMNVIARLKGSGAKKPVLIMGHTDVVGVQKERWTEDPFGGILKGGFIWGRGTLDDKDNLVASLMTMLVLKRSAAKLDRDVIFVAESGEEGSPGVGMQYLIKEHWPEIEAEYALAEGGGFSSVGGKVTHQNVALIEKVPRGVKLVTHGTAGHGSQPRMDNAIVRLSAAVEKVGNWQPPMRMNDITRTYFERLSLIATPEEAKRYRDLFDSTKTVAVQDWFRQNDIYLNSILRTTISPNQFQGGFRSNVIPSEASATLDIRALPDEDMEKFRAEIAKVIGDPDVKIEANPQMRPAPPPSKMDTEMFKVLEAVQKRMFPGTVLLPSMLTGATDMSGLRARGVQCYGVGSEIPVEDLLGHAPHSDNERVKETGLYDFVRYQYEVVLEIAKK